MKLGVFIKNHSNYHKVAEILEWLKNNKIEFYVQLNDKDRLSPILSSFQSYENKYIYRDSDVLLVLGGDGSVLNVAKKSVVYKKPIFGINFGKLGFLADSETSSFRKSISRIIKGNFQIEKRFLLEAVIPNTGENLVAINEMVIDKGGCSRVIRLRVSIDGVFFSDFTADGIIVATPTGSTAYNLSAMGPLLSPAVAAVVLNPINPHALAMRPIVISDESIIEINAKSTSDYNVLYADGQEVSRLQKEDKVIIKKSKYQASFVKLATNNYYEILRKKLGWGGFIDKKN